MPTEMKITSMISDLNRYVRIVASFYDNDFIWKDLCVV